MNGRPTAAAAGKIDVGGDLRRAVALDVNFIDTADSYGPEVSERLIAEALYLCPEDLVIAAKGGLVRPGPQQWIPDGCPQHLHGTLGELKDEGKIRHIGVSNVTEKQFRQAERVTAIVSVQNRYNVVDRGVTERQVALAVLSR
jgi:pyridoxine 4-dehydrogenase